MTHLRIICLGIMVCLAGLSQAQVITVTPVFPQATDSVEIIFDATQGNGALNNVGPVYAHTGVITNLSATPTTWRHVKGNWGTADPTVAMTSLGNNRWRIKYHLRNFYGVPVSETILAMAFVFRNTNGSIVGRNADGSDIFYTVYSNTQLNVAITAPAASSQILAQGSNLTVTASASDTANMTLTDNGTQVFSGNNITTFTHFLTVGGPGTHTVIATANAGATTVRDTIYYTVNPAVTVAPLPAGTLPGLTRVNATTMRLRLDAPGKSNAYILSDLTDYLPDTAFFMRRTPDGNSFWRDFTVGAGQVITYQYLVNGNLKVADPFSELVLDPSNDGFIPAATFPNLPPYPTGKTTSIVSVLDADGFPYNWQVTNFQKPAEAKLVVYELLVRDFLAAHDYQTLLDTLDYLSRLGVNAIEFMPVNEFEGNESWGYNASFHMALDKYYGPPVEFKRLIDACHQRGMAVILDVVFNHAFSQSPLCQLYWDAANFKPSPDNPWLNPDARHPFNVGYDFNHESAWTKKVFTRTMRYWLEEFKVDGFRFDLSKGFTQTNSGSNTGLWGQYDQSRINIWNAYGDSLRATTPDAYLILEHFAENSEETVLSNSGFMLWGNHNYNYNEATMGYISNSNFEWIDYKKRNWAQPKVMGYMESHDEERLMYKNGLYGNSSGGYNVRDLNTALARMELAGNFFFTIPGPKMVWQFGERGYDVSIDDPCRVCNKPPRWYYMNDPERQRLYKVWSALIHLKTSQPVFNTTNYTHSLGGSVKRHYLNDASMDVAVFGNFDVNPQTFNANFQHGGWWYEYWSGDSMNVSNTAMQFTFTTGEYRLYTTIRLPKPDTSFVLEVPEHRFGTQGDLQLWPNPAADQVQIAYDLPVSGTTSVGLYDLHGRLLRSIPHGWQVQGAHRLDFDLHDLPSGNYLIRVQHTDGTLSKPLVVQR